MATEANGEAKSGETVLDAINEALGLGSSDEKDIGTGATGAESDTTLDETGDDSSIDETSGEADQGDESGGDEAGGDEQKSEGAAATKGADKPDVRAEAAEHGVSLKRADGTFKSNTELAAEVAAKKAGDGKQGDKAVSKKAADALNDPIPKDLKPETNQRIRSLIGMAKEATEKATQAEQNFNFMVDGLKAVGATPEQYGETLSFLALFNSNDLKQQGQALDILEDMADKLSTLIGRERKSSDPMEKHPDLVAAVNKREITPQYAREVARTRNQGAFRTELQTAATNSQQQVQAAERELNQARSDLNTLETELQANDPLYARKKAAIVPALKASFKHIPPSKWKAAFQEAYASVRVASAQKPVGGAPKNQPMRAGRNPAGSGAAANGGTGMAGGGPASMLEAVNAALAGR